MKRLVTLVAVVALLMLPTAALASGSSSSCQQYSSLCSVVSNTTAQQGTGQASQTTLPFTGLDVGLLAVGGAVLLAGGLVVRRLSRPTE